MRPLAAPAASRREHRAPALALQPAPALALHRAPALALPDLRDRSTGDS